MTLREDAESKVRNAEQTRVGGWTGREPGRILHEAFFDATNGERPSSITGPIQAGLTGLTPDWLVSTVVANHADDSVRFLFHSTTGEAPASRSEVEVHVLGPCPRCEDTVPLGPAVASIEDVGRVLLSGRPVGHDCPKLWEPS